MFSNCLKQARLVEIDKIIMKIVDGVPLEQVLASNKQLIRKELFFRLAELANAASEAGEKQK